MSKVDGDDATGGALAHGLVEEPPSDGGELSDDPELLASVHALIQRLEVRDIRTVKWCGELHRQGDVQGGKATAQAEVPRFRIADDELNVWFEHTVRVADEEGEIATIAVGVIVDCDLAPGDAPDPETVSCFAETNAFFMAYPYIRESVHTIAHRLGLAGVVLGIIRRDSPLPSQLDISASGRD